MGVLFDLAKFDEYREDNRREVKSASGGLPVSLWDTYSAMANTYGGVIICGVKEHPDGSWSTTGMKDVKKLEKNFWDQANNRNKVSVNLLRESDVTPYEIDGDVILVITVPAADRELKPVYINNDLFRGSFKRNNEGDYHCTEAEVRAMLRDQPRKTIDGKVLEKMELSDLDQDSIKSYRAIMESKRPGHVFLSSSQDRFLEEIGAAKMADDGKLHPTCAGLLMFGKEYKILYEYDLYFLDYREHLLPDVRWTDRIQSQSGDWSGNVFDFFSRVSAKLVLDLKKPFKLVDMVRVDETPMHDAVREALVNCLVNSDFYEPRGVVIEKYPDRIEMRNPGISIVGKQQMLRGGESEPRNGSLMKMFNLIGFGERAGSGVPDIYATWREAGYVDPTVEEQFGSGQPNRTVVTLPLVEKEIHPSDLPRGEEKGEDNREDIILSLMRENPKISISAISKTTGLSKKQIEKAIDTLKSSKRLHREGPDKGGSWIVDD
mgnify:CR=1 FL=1